MTDCRFFSTLPKGFMWKGVSMLKVLADRVVSIMLKGAGEERPHAIEALASIFLRHCPESKLSRYTEEELAERILAAYRVLEVRREGDIKVEGKVEDGRALIFVNMEDQPFLIDTLTLQMEGLGISPDLCVHPILSVERDGEGRIKRVAPSWEEGKMESLILFEVHLNSVPLEEVIARFQSILPVTRDVVKDFVRMKRRLRDAINDMEFYRDLVGDPQGDMEEAIQFLEWLYDEHFVFLGFLYLNGEEDGGLGICRLAYRKVPSLFSIEGLKNRLSHFEGPFLITKGERSSQIYRRGRIDVVAVRSYTESGEPKGWHLFFGRYAHRAYREKAEALPILRMRLQRILQSMKLVPGSYDYKRAIMLYNLLPLEELLISPEKEIQEVISTLLHAGPEEGCLVLRRDREEYLAFLVVLARQKYSARLGELIRERVRALTKAEEIEECLSVYEQMLVLLWFFLYGCPSGAVDIEALEREINLLSQSWEDRFKGTLSENHPPEEAAVLFHRYVGAFPQEYKAITPPQEAAADLLYLERVRQMGGIQVSFHQEEGYTRMKLFSLQELTLSSTVPVLENMGLKVIDEVSFRLERGRISCYVHSYRVTTEGGDPVSEGVWSELAEAIKAVMGGVVENDPLNRLVVKEGLGWQVVDLYRAYRNYLRQIVPHFLTQSVNSALLTYPKVARCLWNYFDAKFNPAYDGDRGVALEEVKGHFEEAMEAVEQLNDDRLLRALFNLMEATLRTNYFRKDKVSHYISFKIESAKVSHMPSPRPMYEIYVHDSGMEGIHLRGGKVARGGIRWSDRPDDFRREILGLMRTQMVKNALIIPVGAKGGFVVKYPPRDREKAGQLAAEKYQILIRGMLDITDNVVDGSVICSPQVVRYDGDDPYLVVAADKGTAHLSDVANKLAQGYGFWLGDAFASGGSTGYSHKELGITAKGAWVCVRRHFMEMGIDPERDAITVVGIGDMSGDVFGNGMLLSKTIKLVGAFNHIHIFLDPDPDPQISWEERMRLFREGKGWDAYNPDLISPGGGVYLRDAKAITLTPQVKALLKTDKGEVSGEELIRLLLKAPVDLLWNGGIGTYVKASDESHLEVGDPANDAVRVNASDLRVKVVGEGGNLGFTQRARIEYAMKGGRIHTDALDNSGGVDLSDHEVNIKILLQDPLKKGKITREERNALLRDVAQQVVDAVLYDNHRQSLAVSLDVIRSQRDLEPFQWMIGKLMDEGVIDDGALIPTHQELVARSRTGRGLTKPELALLLGYEKLWVKRSLRGCPFIKAVYLDEYLSRYFPPLLREPFHDEVIHHLLRDEIVLTIITNTIVNQSGLAFFARMLSELEARPGEVAASYMMMEGVLGVPEYQQAIYNLSRSVPAELQYQSLLEMYDTLEVSVRWSLFFSRDWLPLKEVIAKYHTQLNELVSLLPRVLPGDLADSMEERFQGFMAEGLPVEVARVRAALPHLANAMDIFTLSEAMGQEMGSLASLYYQVLHLFSLDKVLWQLREEKKADHWEVLAYAYLERDLWQVIRGLVKNSLPIWELGISPEALESRLVERLPLGVERLREVRSWVIEGGPRGLPAWMVALRKIREALA